MCHLTHFGVWFCYLIYLLVMCQILMLLKNSLLDSDCYIAAHMDFFYISLKVCCAFTGMQFIYWWIPVVLRLAFPDNVSLPGLDELHHVHARLNVHLGVQRDIRAATWRTGWVQPLLPCALPCKYQQPQSPQTLMSVFSAEHTYNASSPSGRCFLSESLHNPKIQLVCLLSSGFTILYLLKARGGELILYL